MPGVMRFVFVPEMPMDELSRTMCLCESSWKMMMMMMMIPATKSLLGGSYDFLDLDCYDDMPFPCWV